MTTPLLPPPHPRPARGCCTRLEDHYHEELLFECLKILVEERKARSSRTYTFETARPRRPEIRAASDYILGFVNNIQDHHQYEMLFEVLRARPLVSVEEDAVDKAKKERLG